MASLFCLMKMVDDTGIEPVTFPMSRERATAAPIVRARLAGENECLDILTG